MKLFICSFMDLSYLNTPHMLANYVVDAIVHGARSLFGEDAIDYPRLWYLYKDTTAQNIQYIPQLWGKGFSYTGTLDDDSTVDRKDLNQKIETKYFDKIIIPIHHNKYNHYQDMHSLLDYLLQYYTPADIALVDSWDLPFFDATVSKRCTYFKRELLEKGVRHAHPIGGGWIPKEKYRSRIEKSVAFAPLVPASHLEVPNNIAHRNTYIYQDEESYYKQYQESYFAYTCKKGGWDCMRHYEILASYTMPFFTDIEVCPTTCLVDYPKDLLSLAKHIKGVLPGMENPNYMGGCENIYPAERRGSIAWDLFDSTTYETLLEEMIDYSYKTLNTEKMVESILKNMGVAYGNFR